MLLLIAGLELQLLPPVLRRETVITSLAGARARLQRGKLWLMKRKRGRSERVLDTTFAVTLFSLTGLKLTERISYTGSAEMWTRFSFWRVPVSARFQGITAARACLLIYCAKHRFISETAGYIHSFTVSHAGLPPPSTQPTGPYSTV